ncbi:thioredoxin reductase 2, mitochondrial precursor [Corchorus olitorius]|uniref:Thioredoxin reductase 2, mitochondrial n=1 Tax=Corchorus olitorius TaxID=93759 RepID=A0A1R3KBJ5_9ROSI|nr:thioredoxin reductase 2, mitochondrial precursor [Corchorus olitorius]
MAAFVTEKFVGGGEVIRGLMPVKVKKFPSNRLALTPNGTTKSVKISGSPHIATCRNGIARAMAKKICCLTVKAMAEKTE